MVIEAIAAGRRASIAIDKYLKNDASRVEMYDLKQRGNGNGKGEMHEGDESWEALRRLEMPKLSADERKTSFDEIERGFAEDIAKREAKRCLRCDLEK